MDFKEIYNIKDEIVISQKKGAMAFVLLIGISWIKFIMIHERKINDIEKEHVFYNQKAER